MVYSRYLTRVLILLVAVCHVHSEVFTALTTLRKALQYEKQVAVHLRDYVKQEQDRLKGILRLADAYDQHADTALVDAESYIANPINAYLFVKKFTTEFPETISLLSSEVNSKEFFTKYDELKPGLPDEEDLDGVVTAVLRLQDTYQLTAYQIAEGTFTETNRSPPLSAIDCYQFAVKAYGTQDYYHVILWMQEALDRLANEKEPSVSKALVLDYLAYALYNQGNLRHARKCTLDWLEIEPDHERARQNLKFFDHEISKATGDIPESLAWELPPINNERNVDSYRQSQEFKDYEALCRGEDIKPNPYLHRLKCYYYNGNKHPLLIVAPVKAEEFYLDPKVILFHDIVSDKETKIIKEISTPKLQRATVHDPATGELVTAHYRVSKSGWLDDSDNDTVKVLSNRISAITNLNMELAELLQVQNYGIGGQYEPHFDFGKDDKIKDTDLDGDRIATWMFYFSDVDAGGYTVYIDIGIKVPPKKGSAVFWYNLKKSGQGDNRTRHAGCPVLAGSKWVANKWLHERGQEFMRPCGLSKDE